jgi:chromosome segregation ATPase
MSHDDIDNIPSIVPSREGSQQRRSSKVRAGKGTGDRGARGSATQSGPRSGGAGPLAGLFILLSLVAAVSACAWAWHLQQQLQMANDQVADYASRVGDLEDRLSDTDEGMNQNAAVQVVKISELESEVRKLWDDRKKSRGSFKKLEDKTNSYGKSIKGMDATLSKAESQLKDVSGDLAKLKGVSGDLSRLMTSAKTNQAEVERVADALNRINLGLSKLEKRVQGNEEWVGSINAFRKQVNARLAELQDAQRVMQSSP